MNEPKIAARMPKVIDLEPGTYYWCSCGLSQNQPFCDGSHATTELSPREFELPKTRRVALCTCKRTQNPPFCDGTHSKLP